MNNGRPFSRSSSARMRQCIPTILCPNDFAAYPGYRQFRNRLLLVESFCECQLDPAIWETSCLGWFPGWILLTIFPVCL
jgi:hypothetical protein